MSVLLLVVIIFLVLRNERQLSDGNIIVLGLFSGLFIFNRPSDSLLILPILVFVLWYNREKIEYYVLSGVIAGLQFLFFNVIFFYNILGGSFISASLLTLDVTTLFNYLGLLFAPNKGLFIFSLILIFSIFGFWITRKKNTPACRFLQGSVIAMALTVLVNSTFDDWSGGIRTGPGILPACCLFW
jgi:hypothetical protein